MAPADTGAIDTSDARAPHCTRTAKKCAHQRTHLLEMRPLICGCLHDSKQRAYEHPTTINAHERRRERSQVPTSGHLRARRASGVAISQHLRQPVDHGSSECGFEGRGVRVRELGFMQEGHLISLDEPGNHELVEGCRDESPMIFKC